MAKQTGGGTPDIAGLLAQVKAGVQGVTTAALAGLTVVTKEVNAFARSFVEAFRPDVVKRFDIASRDLLAVVGEGLVPAMELGTLVVREFADILNGLYKATRDITEGGFGLLRELFDQLKPVVMEFVTTVASAWIPIQKQLLALVTQLAPVFVSLVSAVAPAVATILEMQAAIGGALVGALAAVVPVVKVVADILGGLLPIIVMPFKMLAAVVGPLVQVALWPLTQAMKLLSAVMGPSAAVFEAFGQAIGEVGGAIGDLVKDALKAFMTIVGDLFNAFSDLFDPMREFIRAVVEDLVQGITDAVKWLMGIIKQLRELLGLPTKDPAELEGDSKGKAAKGVRFGSPDDMWRAVVQATAGAGRAEPVKDIKKDVGDMKKIMGDMAKSMEKVAENTTVRAATNDPKVADMWRNQELRRG